MHIVSENQVTSGLDAGSPAQASDAMPVGTSLLPVKTGSQDMGAGFDPAVEAERIMKYMRAGYFAVLRACKITTEVSARIKGDSGAMDRFSGVFVAHGFLTAKEALLGSRSKLSMLEKVGEYEAILATPDVSRLLPPSYSTLYQAALLYEKLVSTTGDDVRALSAFIQGLEAYDGDGAITRSYIIDKRNELKRKLRSANDEKGDGGKHSDLTTVPSPSLVPSVDPQLANIILITPTERDWRRLREFYADPSAIKGIVALADRVAEDATLAVVGRVSDIALIHRLALMWEFPAISHVISLPASDEVDLIDAKVIITAERVPGKVEVPHDRGWSHEHEGRSMTAPAELLVPGAKAKLHVFASEETEGWVSWSSESIWRQVA